MTAQRTTNVWFTPNGDGPSAEREAEKLCKAEAARRGFKDPRLVRIVKVHPGTWGVVVADGPESLAAAKRSRSTRAKVKL